MTVVLEAQTLSELLTAWALQPPVRLTPVVPGGTTSDVWRVDAANGVFAAKLVHDEPRFVEPGLRVAAAGGMPTGGPVPTTAGAVAVHVPVGRGSLFTLALLDWCDGNRWTPPTLPRPRGPAMSSVEFTPRWQRRTRGPRCRANCSAGSTASSRALTTGVLVNPSGRIQAMVRRGLLTMGTRPPTRRCGPGLERRPARAKARPRRARRGRAADLGRGRAATPPLGQTVRTVAPVDGRASCPG
jgi:hypothetical protein